MHIVDRMNLVSSVTENFKWKKNGIYEVKDGDEQKAQIVKVKKVPVFYMGKKKKEKEDQTKQYKPPFVSLEDILKDLEEVPLHPPIKNEPSLLIKEPSNQVYIAPSKIHKLGLFTQVALKKNSVVVEYMG